MSVHVYCIVPNISELRRSKVKKMENNPSCCEWINVLCFRDSSVYFQTWQNYICIHIRKYSLFTIYSLIYIYIYIYSFVWSLKINRRITTMLRGQRESSHSLWYVQFRRKWRGNGFRRDLNFLLYICYSALEVAKFACLRFFTFIC